jgi:hypothetical protein
LCPAPWAAYLRGPLIGIAALELLLAALAATLALLLLAGYCARPKV